MVTRRVLKHPWQVALLLVEQLRRSKRSSMRVSDKSLRAVSGRLQLENSFREQVRIHAMEYGVLLHKLDGTGKSGTLIIDLNQASTAKIALFKDYFSEVERNQISDGSFDFDGLYNSLFMKPDVGDEEDGWD